MFNPENVSKAEGQRWLLDPKARQTGFFDPEAKQEVQQLALEPNVMVCQT